MDDFRQHLETCLHLKHQAKDAEVQQLNELLADFEKDMIEVMQASQKMRFGFAKRAARIFTETRSQVEENRVRMNEELQRSVIRITGAVLLLAFLGMGLVKIKLAIDNQFCEFYNVQGRTQGYETQKPCE